MVEKQFRYKTQTRLKGGFKGANNSEEQDKLDEHKSENYRIKEFNTEISPTSDEIDMASEFKTVVYFDFDR